MNTSDGLAKSTTGVKLRRLHNGNISQIVTETQKGVIRKRLPAAKHYFVSRNHTRAKGFKPQHKDEDARGKKFTLANVKGGKAFP